MDSKMTKYIAVTIGPIYKTFQNVKKTREVWAASYMFSFLMKTIIKYLNDNDRKIKLDRFILPSVTKDSLEYKGAGLFPDRLIMIQKDDDDFKNVNNGCDKAIEEFSKYFDPLPKDQVETFLRSYLRIFVIEKEFNVGVNFLEDLYQHLDTLELQNKPLPVELANKNYLFDFFRNVNRNDFFKANFYGKDDEVEDLLKLSDINGQKRFESLVEISTRDLKNEEEIKIIGGEYNEVTTYKKLINKFLWKIVENNEIDNDQEFIEALKSGLPEKFRNYHKYVAVIKADGDKVGSAIKNMNGDELKIKKFSRKLLDWAIKTDLIIRKHGGIPIYIGGDDVLLFAPVANGENTIVDMINEVDESFTDHMKEFTNNEGEHPTLSWGVSVNYYKYPLYEAMGKVDDLLIEAKNYSKNRNAICIRVLKHSGSELKSVFTKSGSNSKACLENILKCLSNDSVEKNTKTKIEKSYLSSVSYKLRDNEKVIECLPILRERIENFFENNFGDYERKVEKRNPKGTYLFAVMELLLNQLEESKIHKDYYLEKYPNDTEMTKKTISGLALEKVYSTLKISRFIKGLDDEK